MKLYKNKKGQQIGALWPDNIFRKTVDSRKHLLKIMDAFGIDTNVFEDLDFEACEEIRILDRHTDTVYTSEMEAWKKHSVKRDFETPQTFLSRKYMTATPKI